ncbi:beta-1,3-galactosyltransferase 5 [Anabrus simplex]|uniref:beta-1,3-galactosyltransferase 5 n=1 Tax=Anabrus simplex TaxID=316456 RepID=UPI0035A37452
MTLLRNVTLGFTLVTFSVGITLLLFTTVDRTLYSPMFLPRPHPRISYDLYPDEIKLLDFPHFRYIINNDVCGTVNRGGEVDDVKAILLVTSYANDVETRSYVRQAYPSDELKKLGVRRVFLLARINGATVKNPVPQNALLDENKRFSDLIQGNFYEAYRNLTYKHMMGLHWVTRYCPQAKYIIKMDHDIVIDMYRLMELLSHKQYSKPLLLGYVFRGMVPVREPANKWYVTRNEYPNSVYPPFLSGWLYVTTPDVALKLLEVSKKINYFWIDDTFVTGILAKYARIKLQDISEHFTANSEYIECCLKYVGGPKYTCDYIVGPNGGDVKLIVKFQKYAYFCYVNQCPKRSPAKALNKTCVTQWKAKPLTKGHGEVNPIQLF